MSEVEFLLLFNKWDVEYTQLMTAAEGKCCKYKNDHIPFLPGIGLLFNGLHLLWDTMIEVWQEVECA